MAVTLGLGREKLSTRIRKRVQKDLRQYGTAYLMTIPVFLFYILFAYTPMFGAVIAFKDFSPARGIFGSQWADHFGMAHFIEFFQSFYFTRVLRNTVTISLSGLIFGFPIPIIFALSLNEVRNKAFKKTVQTISYMPHFISLVVICSMIRLFTSDTGFIVQLMTLFGYEGNQNLLNDPNAFVPIYVISGIWQQTGWNCIIYLAALAGVDTELYEAARIEGANRFQQTIHISLPGIMGTVVLLLILQIGSILSVGYEKIILLYSDFTMEKADVISSFVYRRGLINGDYSFSAAVGLFNSAINFILVVLANKLSNKVSGMGIW